MKEKIKNIVTTIDHFLFQKFGSDKSLKFLENINEARIIFSYLNDTEEDTQVRFVGGCVRRALSGENINDIDLATNLEPNEVKRRLIEKGVNVVDTGISHGTVTAILKKKKFEITTLRKDISTDGRHAKVEFTKDWEEDASRRDFTINSIYSDIEGRILDPFNGVTDLKKGIIKFIGKAEERIQEDYLRILRYFRFFIQYSKLKHNIDTIRSIKKNINGINKISNERMLDELKKIMTSNNTQKLFLDNDSKEIILNIFPQFKYCERLIRISGFEKKIRNKYDKYLILALLLVDATDNYEYFCHKYKTSKRVKERFKNISENFENLKNKKFYSEQNIKKLIYFLNKSLVTDLLLFSASLNTKTNFLNILKLIEYVENCEIPKFPISGNYLKKYGYEDGRALGDKLKLLEEKWIENNFKIDEKNIEKSLRKNTQN